MASLECSCGLTEGLSAQSEKDLRNRATKWIRDHAAAEEKRIPAVFKHAAAPSPAAERQALPVEHQALQPVKKSDGTYQSTKIGCSCGKQRAGSSPVAWWK